MLEMRAECEACHTALPADQPGATICSYECTWCSNCAESFNHTCPNCNGELVARPARSLGGQIAT